MTLLRAQLRHFVAEQLQIMCPSALVFENRALTVPPSGLPFINLTTPMERKESVGPGAPKFDAHIYLAIDVRMSGETEDALDRLELVLEQVEMGLLANAAVTRLVQEFVAVESHAELSVENTVPVASGRIVFQTIIPQVYDPAMPDKLLEIDIFRDPAMTVPGFEKILPPQ